MDWDKLRVFHAVAEAGSFTHAGENLSLSQSAISRQISALEEGLALPLFHRHARGLILTEQGELLYKTAREIFSKLAMTEALLCESRERAQGPLKITTTVAFGSLWLIPRLKAFQDLYPDIELTVLLTDGELDLSMREADVAIQMASPRQSDLVQRHLITMRYNIYASPSYIQEYGEPKTIQDLDKHRIIIYSGDSRFCLLQCNVNWLLDAGAPLIEQRKPAIEINNIYGICQAIKAGIGIAALPDYMKAETEGLIHILQNLERPEIVAYFVYPEELRHSRRITVFRDFLLREMQQEGAS